jgi:sugar phosphate isomerase/epimerase
MKIGCQENMVPGANLIDRIKFLEDAGYDVIEFWGDLLWERTAEIKSAISKSKLQVSTICSGFRGCLLSNDLGEREQAMNDIKMLLQTAEEIGGLGLIVVPIFGQPRLPNLEPLYTVKQLEEELLIRMLQDLCENAKEHKVLILLEPLNRYLNKFLNTTEQAVALCKRVKHPNLAMMADFFHMNIEEPDMAQSLRDAQPFLRHVHLADSNRYWPGRGHTDFRPGLETLKKIGYRDSLVLECMTPKQDGAELVRTARLLKSLLES